jgi:hypothetical protein
MALTTLHPLHEEQVTCHSASVGATPVATHVRIPFRCKVVKVWSILGGAISSADCTVTTALNGTAITGGAITIANSGSAAGDYDSASPTAANLAQENDVLSFTPASASGSSIPATFGAVLRKV